MISPAELKLAGILFLGVCSTVPLLAGQNQMPAMETKPNIVFILADNVGYGELGVYGGGILRGAPTPRIDRLASEGMRLLNFNVEAQCTPSRSALMTGRFSIRSGTYQVPRGGAPEGLTQWEVTIAELLSARGYATGAWGKWHLGSTEERFPTHQGFDEWYGIPRSYTEALWPSLNETNGVWPSVGTSQFRAEFRDSNEVDRQRLHCHRLALMYRGKVIALGTPAELKHGFGSQRLLNLETSDTLRTSADMRMPDRSRNSTWSDTGGWMRKSHPVPSDSSSGRRARVSPSSPMCR